jgi:hypothetical protein
MRYAILLLTLLFTLTNVVAQKPFEGIIVYTIHDNEGKGGEELTALFGKAGIKLKYRKDNRYDKEVLLINLDSAAVYTLNESERTFTKKNLITRKPVQAIPDHVIGGYNTKAVDMSENLGYLGAAAGLGTEIILYRSDSLFYPIPEKYWSNPELVIVNNNHIVLGADIKMGAGFAGETQDEDTLSGDKKDLANIIAKEIKWEMVDEKEFQVPADFTKYSSYYPNDTMALQDSVTVEPDTIATKIRKPTEKAASKQSSNPKNKSKTTPGKDIRKSD